MPHSFHALHSSSRAKLLTWSMLTTWLLFTQEPQCLYLERLNLDPRPHLTLPLSHAILSIIMWRRDVAAESWWKDYSVLKSLCSVVDCSWVPVWVLPDKLVRFLCYPFWPLVLYPVEQGSIVGYYYMELGTVQVECLAEEQAEMITVTDYIIIVIIFRRVLRWVC